MDPEGTTVVNKGKVGETVPGAETASAPHPMRQRDWLLVAIATAPVVALILAAVVNVGHGYLGVNDNGMNELRVAEIGSHWPFIGPFSRDGWSHPGPALFYLLVLPFRLTGGRSNGLLVGAALINGGAISGMIVLARRRGGTAFAMLVALGCLIFISALGLEFVWDPWNPFLPVLSFGLVVLATWCVMCGDAWCLPIVAGVGSFCVQTHVGYAPLVGVLAVISVIALAVPARHRHQRDRTTPGTAMRTPILVTVGILIAFWILPVLEQFTTTPGNLRTVVHYFRTSNATPALRESYHVVAAQFAWNPDWLVGTKTVNPFSGEPQGLFDGSVPIWWLALGAALAWAWRNGPRSARRLGVVLVITIAASVVAVARTIGPLVEYRLRFVAVLGMLTAAFVAWVLWNSIAHRIWFPARSLAVAAIVTAVGLSTYNVAIAAGTDPPHPEQGRVAAELARQLVRNLSRGSGVVVLNVRSEEAGPLITGIMVELEGHGIPVAMHDTPDDRLRFGQRFRCTGK